MGRMSDGGTEGRDEAVFHVGRLADMGLRAEIR